MSVQPRFEWQRGAPRRARPTWLKWLAFALALLVAFAIGVALGEALHDNPRPRGNVTFVRTLSPKAP